MVSDREFDISDRRLVLQHVALTMHEQAIKEIDAAPLRAILAQQLGDAVDDPRELDAVTFYAIATFSGFMGSTLIKDQLIRCRY